MIPRRSPGQPRPNLLKPRPVVLFGYDAQHPRCHRWLAISARLPFHQDEFDVVFDDRVRFVWLSEERRPVLDLVHRVGDLVPNDRGQIIEANLPAMLLDRRMKRNDRMASVVFSPRETNVAHHANQPSAGRQRLKTALPYFVQFAQEHFVIGHVAELPGRVAVFFQGPIRRGRENQMHRFRFQLHGPSVAQVKIMARRNPFNGLFDQPDQPGVLGDGRNSRLRVGQRGQLLRHELFDAKMWRCDAHEYSRSSPGHQSKTPDTFTLPNTFTLPPKITR